MIEIIYDKNNCENDNEGLIGITLPKNIRQIGSPLGNRRIYIEDYVITYLNQLARPGNTYSRGAILLGEYKKTENGEVIFISGALEAQNFELDLDETVFTNETWSDIYDNVKKNFCDLEVVGWFLSRMGFGIGVNEKILKTHIDNFPGRDKVLYVIDSLENEDAVYLYEKGELRAQSGYYIYYIKNEAMQNYIVEQNSLTSSFEENKESTIIQRDDKLIKNYRTLLSENKQTNDKPLSSIVYVASCFVVLAVLALGITVLNNYGRMKAMETTINKMNLTLEEADKTDVSKENVGEAEFVETIADNTSSDIDDIVENDNKTNEVVTESASTEEALPVISNGNPTYYTVKEGDTLTSISREMYNSIIYIDNILEINGMNENDPIYPGQEIILPTIN